MAEALNIKLLNENTKIEYPVLWATFIKYFPDFSNEELHKLISINIQICGDCHESIHPCYCNRDE